MHIDSSERRRETAAPVRSDELAEGLLLVRASTLKMIRLQLAMERRDRHVALEAVDDLVALDLRLRDYVDTVSATEDQFIFRRELDAERAALNQEKLTLVAEIVRRPANPVEQEIRVEADDDWLGPRDLQPEPEKPRSRRWWLATLPIVASGLAAAAYFVSIPDVTSWLAVAAGALR